MSLAVSALAFQAPALRPVVRPMAVSTPMMAASFDKGMADFKADFPWLAKYGFGPTVKAERWNGRHAMFGWFAILATAVAQKNGFFPDPNTPLTYTSWGGLTQMGFGEFISNERAIIMIAHIHALAVSA